MMAVSRIKKIVAAIEIPITANGESGDLLSTGNPGAVSVVVVVVVAVVLEAGLIAVAEFKGKTPTDNSVPMHF